MQLEKAHSWKKLGVQCLLLALPTIFFAFAVLLKLNANFIILQNQWIYQGVYFSLGILLSLLFYSWRFRFISTAVLLCLLYFAGYKILEKIAVGEFDMFFFSVQYLLFVFIFTIGWLVGFGFSRWRFFTVVWVLFLLAVEIIIVSKMPTASANAIVIGFAPVLLYTFYIIYTSELIRNLNEHQSSFSWFLTKRVGGFVGLVFVVFALIFFLFRKDFSGIEMTWQKVQANYESDKSNSQRMTKINRDGTLSNTGRMPLSGSLNKTKQLVFVARLDNFFSDGQTQNPLYFTANYYTKYDSLTQTFEVDSLMPFNDLFSPDPSEISLFFTRTDSNVIKNAMAPLDRKVVEADVYNVALSPADFVAPSTAFSVQPIPVPREYASQYTAAYHAKMWVSKLNSAYFVYNPAGNNMLEDFQNTRFDILRTDTGYQNIDSNFLQYYISMPQGKSYQKIIALAKQITFEDSTDLDKMLSIRDYFMRKDEFGQPLFQYTDNPGEPGLPNANKLDYFLFENRKGYCAYFAGATLFMLRALHIPSRIATGFLTVDRSSKNPGWYWFYEDQAHAWVQVFFPGYGWIDFDTTIPDVNTQQAPQPDGTPPLGTQKVSFVSDGIIQTIDTTTKEIKLQVEKILFKDKSYLARNRTAIMINAAFAKITADTGMIPFNALNTGMHITAASYDESINKIVLQTNKDTLNYILQHLKKPVPIDEIKIISKAEKTKKQKNTGNSYLQSFNWLHILVTCVLIMLAILIFTILSPWLIWQYYYLRSGSSLQRAHRAILYYLNQLGYFRTNQSPQAFAQEIDQKFDTNFESFSRLYQKDKYSNRSLSVNEKKEALSFFKSFVQAVKRKTPASKRIKAFLNLHHTLHFFIKTP